MNFFGYIKLIKRNYKKILIITIITAFFAGGFGVMMDKTKFSTTIFLSIGIKQASEALNNNSSIYENVQAADQFTETVQGWFKNPSLKEKINGEPDNFSVRKQEKQNLIITYDTVSEQNGLEKAELIKNFTVEQLNNYNQTTNSHFELAIYTAASEAKKSLLPLLVVLGLVSGFIVGFFLSYSYEYLSSSNQLK